MTREHAPRSEFSDALGDWFVEELSVVTSDTPVRRPPAGLAPDAARGSTRRGRWLVGANVALVIGVVAGMATVGHRDVDAPSSDAALASVPPSPNVTAAPSDVEVIVTETCVELDHAVEPLAFDADVAAVEQAVGPIVKVLDRADPVLARLPFNEIEDARTLLEELRTRVADLPSVAQTADRETFDRSVANVDLLIVAVGRQFEQLGGADCGALSTLREQT